MATNHREDDGGKGAIPRWKDVDSGQGGHSAGGAALRIQPIIWSWLIKRTSGPRSQMIRKFMHKNITESSLRGQD